MLSVSDEKFERIIRITVVINERKYVEKQVFETECKICKRTILVIYSSWWQDIKLNPSNSTVS
jgi:hypothetical protein